MSEFGDSDHNYADINELYAAISNPDFKKRFNPDTIKYVIEKVASQTDDQELDILGE